MDCKNQRSSISDFFFLLNLPFRHKLLSFISLRYKHAEAENWQKNNRIIITENTNVEPELEYAYKNYFLNANGNKAQKFSMRFQQVPRWDLLSRYDLIIFAIQKPSEQGAIINFQILGHFRTF